MTIERCSLCSNVIVNTYAKLAELATLLQSIHALHYSVEIKPENTLLFSQVKSALYSLDEKIYTDNPILTINGEAGDDYKGFTNIKPTIFSDLQFELSRMEGKYLNLSPLFTFLAFEGAYLNISKLHMTELRESLERLMASMGYSKDIFFNRDINNNSLGTTQTDWTLMTGHVTAKCIEELRKPIERLWLDRFTLNADQLHWYWNNNYATISGDGSGGSTTLTNMNKSNAKHDNLLFSGEISAHSNYLVPPWRGAFDVSGGTYLNKKPTLECLTLDEGEILFFHELYVAQSIVPMGDIMNAQAVNRVVYDPYKFRCVNADLRPKIRLTEDIFFYVEVVIDKLISDNDANHRNFYDLAFYFDFTNSLGEQCTVGYTFRAGYGIVSYPEYGIIVEDLDASLFDGRWLYISGETLLNLLELDYGPDAYYFGHSLTVSSGAFADARGVGNSSSMQIYTTLKQVGFLYESN